MKIRHWALPILFGLLLLSGCQSFSLTESLNLNEFASDLIMAKTVTLPALATTRPTRTITSTPTMEQTATETVTPLPSATTAPIYTPTSFFADISLYPESETDKIIVQDDMTIPDGTIFRPNEMFVKSWRVENAGEHVWSEEYRLILAYSNPFAMPPVSKAIFISPTGLIDFEIGTWNVRQFNLRKGGVADLVIPLQAPAQEGEYIADYFLLNSQNERVTPHFWIHFYVEQEAPHATATAVALAASQTAEAVPTAKASASVQPTAACTGTAEPYNWSGTWLIRNPFYETEIVPVQAWMTQTDDKMEGFFYDDNGEPVLIHGKLSEDRRIFNGEFAWPWQNKAMPVEWRMLANRDQFYSVTKEGLTVYGSVCGGRNGMAFPDYCSMPGGD